MNPILAKAAAAHEEAWRTAFAYHKAAEGKPTLEEFNALYAAALYARVILEHVGFVDPFECGDCDACKANAAAREEGAAPTATADHGRPLSPDEAEAAARLLRDVFGDTDGQQQ